MQNNNKMANQLINILNPQLKDSLIHAEFG